MFTAAASKPSVVTLNQTNDWALLQCLVQDAFPKPELQWMDSSLHTVPAKDPQAIMREGRYEVILQTIVNKTNKYRCVATQEEIHHEVYTETFVHLNGE